MSDRADVLTLAIAAAREGDLDRLRGYVDWPLSGAASIGRSLAGVLERDRASVAASGLAELDAAADDPGVVAALLQDVAPRLATTQEIRWAEDETRDAALAALRVPDAPPGLTDDQRARLDELRARAAAVRLVYVLVGDFEQMPVARTEDTDRLVLIPD
jgi:hypothetical protein